VCPCSPAHARSPAAAFNSNNRSAAPAAAGGYGRGDTPPPGDSLPAARSSVVRTFLRRAGAFPLAQPGTPRNPKWALNVRRAAAALAARGPHAVAPQVHNVWDRASCASCSSLQELLRAGLTPEVDPCAGRLAALKKRGNLSAEAACARNVCAGGAGGIVGEAVLKMHHYVLPRGAKKYRRGGKGDAGSKRDLWVGDVVDLDALRFAT